MERYFNIFVLVLGVFVNKSNRCLIWGESAFFPNSQDVTSKMLESLLSEINSAYNQLANPSDYPSDYEPTPGEQFDFIVVGAGSAGSVLASRLSEVHNWRVFLLEAGGNPPRLTEIPGLLFLLKGTSIDWQYVTELEEDSCLGMINNTCKWPRGKVLGGSSTMNGMLYTRGHPKDYDSWLEAGNYGWGFKNVLKYFDKSANLSAHELPDCEDYSFFHSMKGMLPVSNFNESELNELKNAYKYGVEELGYKSNYGCKFISQLGFTPFYGTIRDGRRYNTAKAFLSPIKCRKNLKVSKNSLVSKILIDKHTLKAYGVEFINKNGNIVTVKANKEIILSAGTVNSPQLLMLSGIGPKNHLRDLRIEPIKDLKVGENLQDHAFMTGVLLSFNFTLPIKSESEIWFDFLIKSTGRLANVGMLSSGIFINQEGNNNYPEIQYHLLNIDKNREQDVIALTMQYFGIKREIVQSYIEVNKNRHIVLTMPTLLRPKSRGRILLQSKDPMESPKIFAGYLTHRDDINVLLKSIDFIEELVRTKAMKALDAKLHRIDIAGCRQYAFPSKLYWKCAMRYMVTTVYHHTSTCKMGPVSDPDAVVDPRLRIMGIKNLRVADASIMPNIVRGNTNAPSVMIGEKAADLIKKDWNCYFKN